MTRISDEEYFARYMREQRDAIELQDFRTRMCEGSILGPLDPYAVKGDDGRRREWQYYELLHGGLKAMNPDGSFRPWSPTELEA